MKRFCDLFGLFRCLERNDIAILSLRVRRGDGDSDYVMLEQIAYYQVFLWNLTIFKCNLVCITKAA